MTTVGVILSIKGHQVETIDHRNTVFEAIGKMVNHNIGSLVVTDEGHVCGIFTERDYLRRVALEGRSSRTTFVQEVMTPRLTTVDADTDLDECLCIMSQRHIRHLPVLREAKLTGIVSSGDIVQRRCSENLAAVAELTLYIQGRI